MQIPHLTESILSYVSFVCKWILISWQACKNVYVYDDVEQLLRRNGHLKQGKYDQGYLTTNFSIELYQRKHAAGFVFEFVKEMLRDFQEELQTSAFYAMITYCKEEQRGTSDLRRTSFIKIKTE